MQKMHFSILIAAPVEKVWNTMLEDATYRQWTTAFEPGSHFVGSWDEGSEIRFLTADTKMGMYSRIKENRLHEFVSIEHLGIIKDGVVDTTSDDVKAFAPSFENYTFTTTDSGTEVSVAIDVSEQYKEMFEEMWPRALEQLKALAEK